MSAPDPLVERLSKMRARRDELMARAELAHQESAALDLRVLAITREISVQEGWAGMGGSQPKSAPARRRR